MACARAIWPVLLGVLLLSSGETAGQRSGHVRVFPMDGPYVASVSISPRGQVLARSGESPKITWLDGYTQGEVVSPEANPYRVYESRTGQWWALYSEGLLLYQRGEWRTFAIPEIRDELRRTPVHQLRQLSLVPADINRVLVLLPEQLLEFDAGTGKLSVIKQSTETSIGRYSEMAESADGGLWLSGRWGMAKVPGPLRRIAPGTEWEQHILNRADLGALQRPHENPPGSVTMVASSIDTGSRRAITEWREGTWSIIPIEAERPRQAWRAWDRFLWGYSYGSLFRVQPSDPPVILREPAMGAQFDVALGTNGVFWVASVGGLVRYAPHLWRPLPELEGSTAPTHALIESSRDHRLWMASSEGLTAWQNGVVGMTRWPEELDLVFQPGDALYEAPNGGIVATAQDRAVVFTPEIPGVTGGNSFRLLQGPEGAPVQVAGQLRDGLLWVWQPRQTNHFYLFDGAKFEPVPLALPATEEISFVRQLSNRDVWIATDAGLVQTRAVDESLVSFGREQGLPADRASCLAEVGEGRIWCGTGSGIYELRDRQWELVYMTGSRVTAIERGSDGSIWVATSAGLIRHVHNSWIRHGYEEGLPAGVVFGVLRDRAGRVWASTSRGVSVFHPDADPDPPRPFEPVLAPPDRPSTGKPTEIMFSGMDRWNYSAAFDLLFSYRLDEGSWTPYSNVANRVFHNLSSGEHQIEVRAMDKNGNRSAGVSRLSFAVVVPWTRDPRLLGVSIAGAGAIFFLAGLAVKKHLDLKQSYAEVGKIVAQRTRELERANQELLHSQKMRAIGTMAAGIAHDFNNILSIIKGSTQIIEENPHDLDKLKTRINRIQTVVDQGTAVVQALLGLGRLNDRPLAEVDLMALLEETRRLLADRFPATLQLRVKMEAPIAPVLCSQDVLSQMLLNLILNAAEAMSNRGELTLEARRLQRPLDSVVLDPALGAGYVHLTVSDTGCGIPPENVARVFEPFFTTKAFSTRRGTGLGLSMVYELAKGMGYGLSVRSELGKGSTFGIIIPIDPLTPPSPA